MNRYWVDDDGYIMYGNDDKQIVVCEMYPEHVQALTKIIESHDDLLAVCKYALPLIIGERLKNDIFPPKDDLEKYLAGLFETCEKKLESVIKKAERDRK